MCSYIYRSNNCRTTPAKQDKLLHCGTCSSIYCWISNGFCSLEQFCWWLPFSAALFGESIQLAWSKPQRILLIGATSAYTVSCQLPFLHSLPSQFPTPVVILRFIPDKISYQALLKIHQHKLWAILFGKYCSIPLSFPSFHRMEAF